jgi:hypothetical protein
MTIYQIIDRDGVIALEIKLLTAMGSDISGTAGY